jgi:hypothetical protein
VIYELYLFNKTSGRRDDLLLVLRLGSNGKINHGQVI